MLKHAIVVLAALLAAGCACAPPATTTPVLFVVVPAPDGHIGKIEVTAGGETRVIDTAYGAQRVGSDGKVQASTLSQSEVQTLFGSTMDALPGIATSYTLYFLEGKDELTPESKVELDKVLGDLKRRPLPDIMVIGHTDTVGSLDYNDKLSHARAERMRELMVSLGIPAGRVQAAGRGKRELLVPTEDNVAEARNRRVEISVR